MTSTNVSCPFEKSICRRNISANMDSGYYDSQLDLGINAHPNDRVKVRKTFTCAPIVTDGYFLGPVNTSEAQNPTAGSISDDSNQQFVLFYYGPNPAQGELS